MTIEQAISTVVYWAPCTPSLQHGHDFRSVEALTAACDPAVRGVGGAASNRALVRRLAAELPSVGEWQVTPEEVQAELAELQAAGFSCGCGGGACAA